jgi:hypothetical protein
MSIQTSSNKCNNYIWKREDKMPNRGRICCKNYTYEAFVTKRNNNKAVLKEEQIKTGGGGGGKKIMHHYAYRPR